MLNHLKLGIMHYILNKFLSASSYFVLPFQLISYYELLFFTDFNDFSTCFTIVGFLGRRL
jgi:hypothetical protein